MRALGAIVSELEIVRLVLGAVAAATFTKAGLDQGSGTAAVCYGLALVALMLGLPVRPGRASRSVPAARTVPGQPAPKDGAATGAPPAGAALVEYIACRSCGSENWIGYRECQGCGSRLA